MVRRKNIAAVCSAAFVMGATLGVWAVEANAYWVDLSAGVCQVELPGTNNWSYSTDDHAHHLANSSTSVALKVACPVVDNTDMDVGNGGITSITVRVWDGNDNGSDSQVIARACAWLASDSTGGSCNSDDKTGTSFTGPDELQPPLGALGTDGETPYLYLTLPKSDVASSKIYSTLFED